VFDFSVRVLVVDDHPLVREGLCQLLGKSKWIQVVGAAESGVQALEQVKERKPDVVLMDISLGKESGILVAEQLRSVKSDCKILFLSMHSEEVIVARALSAGGAGYLLKSNDTAEIVEAIRVVQSGSRFLSRSLNAENVQKYMDEVRFGDSLERPVSERELEVLKLVAEGLSAKEVAARLGISHRTVEVHRNSLIRKLGARNSAELVKIAIAQKLV
jgi:DNA-binding NarL/FixJ family response regulator